MEEGAETAAARQRFLVRQYIGAEIHQEPNIKVSHLRREQSHRDPQNV